MSFKDMLGIPKGALGDAYPNTGERWIVDKDNLFVPSAAAFGTITGYSARYRRRGDELSVVMSFICGSVSTGAAIIRLPSFLRIDSTKVGPDGDIVGTGVPTNADYNTNGSIVFIGPNITADTNYVIFTFGVNGSGVLVATAGDNIANSSVRFYTSFTVPIESWRE